MDDAEFAKHKARLKADTAREREPARDAIRQLAREQMAGVTGPLTYVPDRQQEPPAVEVDESSLFSRRAERIAEAAADHRARRRRADAETASQDRLHAKFRDLYGIDAADRMLG